VRKHSFEFECRTGARVTGEIDRKQRARATYRWIAWISLAGGMASAAFPARAAPLDTTAGGMRVTLATTPDPPEAGQNQLELKLSDSAGRPVNGAHITLSSAMYTMNMAGPSAIAARASAGEYHASILFGMAGPWRISAHVTPPGRKPVTASFRFNVAAAPPATTAVTQHLSSKSMSGTEGVSGTEGIGVMSGMGGMAGSGRTARSAPANEMKSVAREAPGPY
jgi:hypothetical protein